MEVYSKESHHLYKTPAYRLFYLKYDIIAPRRMLARQVDLDVYGFYVTGDPELDADPDGGMDRTRANVIEIAKLCDKGVCLAIVDPEEAILIYNDIMAHLNNWLAALDQFEFRNRCPFHCLEIFETLARDLHDFAMTKQDNRTAEESHLMQLVYAGRRSAPSSSINYLTPPFESVVERIRYKMANENFGLYDPD